MRWMTMSGVVAMLSGVVMAQPQGDFFDLVVTTDDGDSVVEEGEAAIISLYVDMSAATLLGLRSATFDTMGGENAETGGISGWSCLNGLCDVNGDTTVTDDVSLFGTNLLQLPDGPGFTKDAPVAVFRFVWKTEDFTPRTVRYHTLTSSMTFWVDDVNWVPAAVVEAEVAFCVGACVAEDVPPDLPFGLEHETLGSASFDVDDRGRIALVNLGDDGGVRMSTGDAEYHRIKVDPEGLGEGTSIEFAALAEGTNNPIEVLKTRVEGGGESWSLFVGVPDGRPHTYEFTAFLGDEAVHSATCELCDFDVEPVLKAHADTLCAVTPHIHVENDRVVSVELVSPSTISTFDGADIVADRVEVRVLDLVAPEPTHTRVLPVGPTSLSIIEEDVGAFGFRNRSLDGAHVDAGHDHLTVSNIGSSGDDGVSVDHGLANGFAIEVAKPPDENDEYLRFEGRGTVGPRGRLRTICAVQTDFSDDTPNGMPWAFMPDFTGIADPLETVACEAWLGDQLVGTQFGPAGDPPLVAFQAFGSAFYGSEIITGTGQQCTVFLKHAEPVPASDSEGNPIGLVDQVRCYLPTQLVTVVLLGSGVRAAGMAEVLITDEHFVVESCFADCDGNGTLNILDFVCYQGLFVGGDLAADCDGNNALNILDFVCFQGKFVGGCP